MAGVAPSMIQLLVAQIEQTLEQARVYSETSPSKATNEAMGIFTLAERAVELFRRFEDNKDVD